MSLKKIKLHSTELNERDAELIDNILIEALKGRGIDFHDSNNPQDSFGWELDVLVVVKSKVTT